MSSSSRKHIEIERFNFFSSAFLSAPEMYTPCSTRHTLSHWLTMFIRVQSCNTLWLKWTNQWILSLHNRKWHSLLILGLGCQRFCNGYVEYSHQMHNRMKCRNPLLEEEVAVLDQTGSFCLCRAYKKELEGRGTVKHLALLEPPFFQDVTRLW